MEVWEIQNLHNLRNQGFFSGNEKKVGKQKSGQGAVDVYKSKWPKPRYSLGSSIYRRIGGRDLSNGWNPLDTANRKNNDHIIILQHRPATIACAISFIFVVYNVVCSYST